MSGHLGGELAALVDGELGHADRERALRHLAHCDPCRAEVDAHRRFKARLRGLSATAPAPDPQLADRLLALGRPDAGAGPRPAAAPRPAAVPEPAGSAHPAALGPAGASRPAAAAGTAPPGGPTASSGPRSRTDAVRPGGRRRLPRAAVGGAALALGLGAVLALGGPQRPPSRTPLDPTSDVFLDEHAFTTAELPLSDPSAVLSDPSAVRADLSR